MPRSIYTDLAMEARELNPKLPGVREEVRTLEDITVTTIRVETQEAAKRLQKPCGEYITLDAPDLALRPLDLFERVSKQLAQQIRELMPELKEGAQVLVIGLGNRFITPDALGPRVVEQVFVTRHILEYMPEILEGNPRAVAAFAPGVLGLTGVETLEVVQGVVERVKPALVIAVDSLASRRANRISTTIQLTDTGIEPGAGVGNLRQGINRETLGVPVIALGVPMVVYASTITQDTISLIAEQTQLGTDEQTLLDLAEKVIHDHFGPMIVTPKDIDSIVRDMSQILADGLNMALMDTHYEQVRMLVQ